MAATLSMLLCLSMILSSSAWLWWCLPEPTPAPAPKYLPSRGVTVYRDFDQGGPSSTLDRGSYPSHNVFVFGNDALSSLSVANGYKVIVYEHGNFGGQSYVFYAGHWNVSNAFNDKCSSIKVLYDWESDVCPTPTPWQPTPTPWQPTPTPWCPTPTPWQPTPTPWCPTPTPWKPTPTPWCPPTPVPCYPSTLFDLGFDYTYSPFKQWGYASASLTCGTVKLTGQTGGLEYVFAGEANATYEFTARVKADCGKINVGLKNTHEYYETVSGGWKTVTVRYTTTSATTLIAYLYLPTGCSTTAYVDYAKLTKICN